MANQEPFTFRGRNTEVKQPHAGSSHVPPDVREVPFGEGKHPLTPDMLDTPVEVPGRMTWTDDERRLARQHVSRRTAPEKKFGKRTVAGVVGGAILGTMGVAYATFGGGQDNAEPRNESTSAPANPGETSPDFQLPERVSLPQDALEGINEEEWGNIFNMTIPGDAQWFLATLIHNPKAMEEVPADVFTDTPDSELVNTLRDMARQIVTENPDAADILPIVCPTSTQSTNLSEYGCSTYSSFVSDPEDYPDISSLSVEYVVQDQEGNFSENKQLFESLTQSYRLIQDSDGTLKINED